MSTTELLTLLVILQAGLLTAALALGLLASYHNRRQAQALAEARDTLEAWYAFNTRVHRESRAGSTLVSDGLTWLASQVEDAAEAAGHGPLALRTIERIAPEFRAVEILAQDGRRLVVTPLCPRELRRAQGSRPKDRLAQALAHPLLPSARGLVSVERSLLNAGDYFDLEAAQAGALLNVPGWSAVRRLWFHIVPAPNGHARRNGEVHA